MKKTFLALIFVMLLINLSFISAKTDIYGWNVNTTLSSGLGDIGGYASPEVFNLAGSTYLISGKMTGSFSGFLWNGSGWNTNAAIISGLTDVGDYSFPAVFNIDSNYHLIAGENAGGFFGFSWNGSTWSSNNTLVSGLPNSTNADGSTLDIFYLNSNLYSVVGDDDGTFRGFLWNGSGWDNNTISSGLVDIGAYSSPMYYNINSISYLLSGKSSGYAGFILKGNSWIRDYSSSTGLASDSAPRATIFNSSQNYYLIVGKTDGTFSSYQLNYTNSANYQAKTFIFSNQTTYAYPEIFKIAVTGVSDEFGSVVVKEGVGYVASKGVNKNIWAFNSTTGDILWSTFIGDMDGTPLIDSDAVYINTYNSTGASTINGIYKLNKTSGAILAQNNSCSGGGFISYWGVIDSLAMNDKFIFGGCMDGTFRAYNKNDLIVNWSYATGSYISNTPLYLDDKVIFSSANSSFKIVQLNASNGSLIWKSSVGGDLWDNKPAYSNDVIYYSGGVFAINWTNGSLIWNAGTGGFGEVAINNGAVWTPRGIASSSKMSKLNISTGSLICSYNLTNLIYQGPSISGGMVFFGGLDDYLYAINETDCSLLWKHNIGGAIYSAPAIAQGKLYIATDSYHVHAFDLGSGSDDWIYLGYDENGTSYSSTALTLNKPISINCGVKTGEYVSCNITNNNNYKTNVALNYSSRVYWRVNSVLIASNSTGATIQDLDSAESRIILLYDADATAPVLDIISPTSTTYNTRDILINFSATDNQEMGSLWYFDGSNNYTYTFPLTLSLTNENYIFIFYANDSSGNIAQQSLSFSVDALRECSIFENVGNDLIKIIVALAVLAVIAGVFLWAWNTGNLNLGLIIFLFIIIILMFAFINPIFDTIAGGCAR